MLKVIAESGSILSKDQCKIGMANLDFEAMLYQETESGQAN